MKPLSGIVLFGMPALTYGGYAEPPALIYKNTFDSPEALSDWVMEGPGIAQI